MKLAAEAGLITPPVRIWGPPADADLSMLPSPTEVAVIRQPDYDRLAARGINVTYRPEGRSATAVVCLPRDRTHAMGRIARAAASADVVLIDGQKTDGIDAMLRACRKRGRTGEPIVKAHGKLFAFEGDVADWHIAPTRTPEGHVTLPGIFSWDGIDPGSRLLAESLPPLSGRVADLGAGWGYLSAEVLSSGPQVASIDLVEADRHALECARRNVADARAAFHWADATAWRPADPLDHVVTNPPFHAGRRADPGLGRDFIAQSARILGPRGTLWLVANRHLPYEGALAEHFAEVEERPGTSAYKIARATRPRRRHP